MASKYKLHNGQNNGTVILFVDGEQKAIQPGKTIDLPDTVTREAANRLALSNGLQVLDGKEEVEGNIAPSVPHMVTDKPHSLRTPSESQRVAEVTHEPTPNQAEVRLPVDFVQAPGAPAIQSKAAVAKEEENKENSEELMKKKHEELVEQVVLEKKVGKGDVNTFTKAQLVSVLTGDKSVEEIKQDRSS